MYALLRAIAGVALRWYYRDIQIEGLERLPRDRPLLLTVNHPNALIDALLVGWIVPRRVLITAKSTLFTNPLFAVFLRWLGVVPLRRTSDESHGVELDPSRNIETFRAVIDALARRGTVLIFPEGKSHDEPSLAPLKTGAARMALQALQSGRVYNLAIVPIGLTFEQKESPRTRVLVQVGEPIDMDIWHATAEARPAEALTAEIDARLRAVTLNYASLDDAARAVRLSSTIAALVSGLPEIGLVDRGLAVDTAVARRLAELAERLALADAQTRAEAEHVVRRLEAVSQVAGKYGILIEDVGITLYATDAARFVMREGWILLIAGPIAAWGRINHWLPFRAARLIATRSVESAADPAMRTLVAGLGFVLATYAIQTTLVTWLFGVWIGLAYLASLPLAAEANFYLSDRLKRAWRRARTFLRFRRDPELQARLTNELESLRAEVIRLDQALSEPQREAAAQ